MNLDELLGTWVPDFGRMAPDQAYALDSWLVIEPDRVGLKGFDKIEREARWFKLDPQALRWRLRRLPLIDCDLYGDELVVTLIRGWRGDFSLKVRGEDAMPWGDTFPVRRQARSAAMP